MNIVSNLHLTLAITKFCNTIMTIFLHIDMKKNPIVIELKLVTSIDPTWAMWYHVLDFHSNNNIANAKTEVIMQE